MTSKNTSQQQPPKRKNRRRNKNKNKKNKQTSNTKNYHQNQTQNKKQTQNNIKNKIQKYNTNIITNNAPKVEYQIKSVALSNAQLLKIAIDMKDSICPYYNPYFKCGCNQYFTHNSGNKCKKRHLKESEFVKYCISTNKRSPVTNKYSSMFKRARESVIERYNTYEHCSNGYKILSKLLLYRPLDGLYNLWMGRCYEKLNKYPEANYFYRKAIAIQPNDACYHGRYAQFSHFTLQSMKQAGIHYKKSLEIRQNLSAVHCNYGIWLVDIKCDYPLAIHHFKKCLQIFDGDEKCQLHYAKLLYKMKHLSQAKKHFLKAMNYAAKLNKPPFIWCLFHYAQLLKDMKNYSESAMYFNKCYVLLEKRKCNQYSTYDDLKQFAIMDFEYGLLLYYHMNERERGLQFITDAVNCDANNVIFQQKLIDIQNESQNIGHEHKYKSSVVSKKMENNRKPMMTYKEKMQSSQMQSLSNISMTTALAPSITQRNAMISEINKVENVENVEKYEYYLSPIITKSHVVEQNRYSPSHLSSVSDIHTNRLSPTSTLVIQKSVTVNSRSTDCHIFYDSNDEQYYDEQPLQKLINDEQTSSIFINNNTHDCISNDESLYANEHKIIEHNFYDQIINDYEHDKKNTMFITHDDIYPKSDPFVEQSPVHSTYNSCQSFVDQSLLQNMTAQVCCQNEVCFVRIFIFIVYCFLCSLQNSSKIS